jgi:hypothetical protein
MSQTKRPSVVDGLRRGLGITQAEPAVAASPSSGRRGGCTAPAARQAGAEESGAGVRASQDSQDRFGW